MKITTKGCGCPQRPRPQSDPPSPGQCTNDKREQIVDLLMTSVDLQENGKVGMLGGALTCLGGIAGTVAAVGEGSGFGLGFGLAAAAGGGALAYLGLQAWNDSKAPLQQALELNQQTGCYSERELRDIYNSIP